MSEDIINVGTPGHIDHDEYVEIKHTQCGEVAILYKKEFLMTGEIPKTDRAKWPDGTIPEYGSAVVCHNCKERIIITIVKNNVSAIAINFY